MKGRFSIRQLVFTGVFAAVIFVLTALVPIPLGHGYANFGDTFVILSAFLLGPWCGMLASGIGSMLADLYLSYAVYAPATFIIKGLMAFAAGMCAKAVLRQKGALRFALIAAVAVISELIMVVGYFIFEWMFFDLGVAVADVAGNAVQGAFGVVAGSLLVSALEKIARTGKITA